MPRTNAIRSTQVILGLLILLITVGGIFGKSFSGSQAFGFRDAAHFYYPLFQWSTDQWKQNQSPLWNPLEDLGCSVLADGTSSLFYPGKVLFFLPGSFGFWYKAYIALHVVLCGLTAAKLARHFGASYPGATLAAISYAISGNVLFQYCNVVYLVGAAWLPLAILFGDRLVRDGGSISTIGLAMCLALMVLGGDAQMAYHSGLLLIGRAWILRDKKRPLSTTFQMGLRLVFAAMFAICLAAIQSLPSAQWIANSNRASYDQPRSLYEYWQMQNRDQQGSFTPALLGKLESGHHSKVYDFSVGPWRWPELLWPNLGGSMFPENERWMNALPAEGRVWTPTLYLGLFPALLSSLAIRFRGGSPNRRFLSWCLVATVLAGLGRYGLGWLLAEIHYHLGGTGELAVGEPFGGLYWLGTLILPNYVYFRYPAKIWIMATLAISLLAAIGLQPMLRAAGIRQRLLRRSSAILAISLALAAFVRFLPIPWHALLQHATPDEPFGPLQIESVAPRLVVSFLHTCLLATVFLVILRYGRKLGRLATAWTLVIVTAVELTAAHHSLVALVPERCLSDQQFVDLDRTNPPTRIVREGIAYPQWQTAGSPFRLMEVVQANSESLFPKHHLTQNLAILGSRHSMTSCFLTETLAAIREIEGRGETYPVSFLGELGVSYRLQAVKNKSQSDERCKLFPIIGESENTSNQHDRRRVWIVRDLDWVHPIAPRNRSALQAYCRYVVQPTPDRGLRDLSKSVVVEASVPPKSPPVLNMHQTAADGLIEDDATITSYGTTQLTIEANLAQSGMVVINDAYDQGWKAYVSAQSAPPTPTNRSSVKGNSTNGNSTRQSIPIYRANAIMRGVYLPAGRYKISLRYQPEALYQGGAISAIAWCFCSLYLVIHFRLQFVWGVRTHA